MDMSWSGAFAGLCLTSTPIRRIVLADTLHVEFQPKIRPGNPSVRDANRIHGRQSSTDGICYDLCMLLMSRHSTYSLLSQLRGAEPTSSIRESIGQTDGPRSLTTATFSRRPESPPASASRQSFSKGRKNRKPRQALANNVVKFHPSY